MEVDFKLWVYLWHSVFNLVLQVWLLTQYPQNSPSPGISRKWISVYVLSILLEIFVIMSFKYYNIKPKLWISEILHFSGNIESTKKADHILKIPGLGEPGGYCFKNHTCYRRLTNKTTFQSSCYCHVSWDPPCVYFKRKIYKSIITCYSLQLSIYQSIISCYSL